MKCFVLAVLLVTLLAVPALSYEIVQNHANGHWYEPVLANGISWESAEAQAESKGGYLACANTQSENSFLYGLVQNRPEFWVFHPPSGNYCGPWLGGYQPTGSVEPLGDWRWIDGSPMSFTNWAPNEPNDSYGIEDYIQLFGYQTPTGSYWNDFPGIGVNPAGTHITGYIVEYNSVPEPSSLLALGAGIATLTTLKRRKRG